MPEPTLRPLIGRSEDRARLINLLTAATAGQPGIALVGGDAGAGKTRLLQELAAAARDVGALVLVGSCVQVGDFGLPYLPIIDALRSVEASPTGAQALRDEAATRPALARLLPQLGIPVQGHALLGEEVVQGQLFEGVHRILTALAESAPVVLILEDVHWADRSTRDLMSFLVRTLREGRIAVLASYRTDDVHRRHPLRPLLSEFARLPHVVKIKLSPLTRAELAQFIDDFAGLPVDPQVIDQVFQRSEGNAFFAEELTRAYVDGAAIRHLPATLADVLLTRVDELSESGRETLRVAAVAGRRAGYDLLLLVAQPDSGSGSELGLREAVEAGLLTTDGETYAFRHALMQEAIYADLLPGERVYLHSRFADVLGGAPQNGVTTTGPAELAHHRLASHDLTGALDAVLQAATQAEKVAAPAEALVHLEQALALHSRLQVGADRLDLLIRAADAAAAVGEPSRAVAHGRAAVLQADLDSQTEDAPAQSALDRRVSTRERLSRLLMEDDQDADQISREAAELLPVRPANRLRAMALATRSRVLLYQDPDSAQKHLNEAIDIATEVGADAIAADALATKGLMIRRAVVPHDNPRSESLSLLTSAVAKASTAPESLHVRLRILRFLSSALMEDGDISGALEAADEGVALAARAGLTWSIYGLDLQLMRGWAWYATGRWDEVIAASLHAVYAPTPPGRVLATQAVAVLVARGDPAAEDLLPKLRAGGDFLAEIQLDLAESTLRLDEGRPGLAVSLAEAAMGRIVDFGWATENVLLAARAAAGHADLAIAARAVADLSTAAAHVAAASALAEQAAGSVSLPTMRGPYGQSWIARVAAEAHRANGSDSPADWALVSEQAVAAGRQEEQVYAGWRRAQSELDAGHRDRGVVQLLTESIEQARALHATPMVQRLEKLVKQARLSTEIPLGQRVSTSDTPLTARESDVLALVAQGLSNKQIGRQLFISDKTASVHVSNILAKLQAGSRTEAAALARQRGLLGPDVGASP